MSDIKFEEMAKTPAPWLSGAGEESLVVLSTRVRLARNVAGCQYPTAADAETRQRIMGYVDSVMSRSDLLGSGTFCKANELEMLDRDFLVERHIISPVFLGHDDTAKGVWMGSDERLSIMVNEEDHFRVQGLSAGLDVSGAYQMAANYEREIGQHLEFDYDADFGYLTACPTNAGTGMRASVLIHLPGLVLTKEIERVIQRLTQSGLIVRGYYGEGSDVAGNLFQISNQNTLGITEAEIMSQILRSAQEIVSEEAEARQHLMDQAQDMIEDKIWRAYGILKTARMLSGDEVMNLLSAIRLGHALKIIDFLTVSLINDLLLLSQPAHLQKFFGTDMDAERRDHARAQLVREKLRNSISDDGV